MKLCVLLSGAMVFTFITKTKSYFRGKERTFRHRFVGGFYVKVGSKINSKVF